MLIRKGNVTYNTDYLSEETIYLLVEDGFKEVKEKKKRPSVKKDAEAEE